MRLYYASLGVKVVSEESARLTESTAFSLYGKRKANDRKYTDVKDHHLAVLNSPGVCILRPLSALPGQALAQRTNRKCGQGHTAGSAV